MKTVVITDRANKQAVITYEIEASDALLFDEAWRCVVADGLADGRSRAEFAFSVMPAKPAGPAPLFN